MCSTAELTAHLGKRPYRSRGLRLSSWQHWHSAKPAAALQPASYLRDDDVREASGGPLDQKPECLSAAVAVDEDVAGRAAEGFEILRSGRVGCDDFEGGAAAHRRQRFFGFEDRDRAREAGSVECDVCHASPGCSQNAPRYGMLRTVNPLG